MVLVLLTSSPAKYTVKTIMKFSQLYVYQIDDKVLLEFSVQTNQLLSVTPRIEGRLNMLKFQKNMLQKQTSRPLLWNYAKS